MKPGDMIKFREGMGFSWWSTHLYTYLYECDFNTGWCYVLQDTGKIMNVEKYQLEVIS